MKIQIDVVTGFLGSGKTAFINKVLSSSLFSQERIVVVQCEFGEEVIEEAIVKSRDVQICKLDIGNELTVDFLKEVVKKYLPHRIIVEYNGMKRIGDVLDLLEDRWFRRTFSINKIFHMIDSTTFEVFMNNMGAVFIEQIAESDMVMLNNTVNVNEDKLKGIKRTVQSINRSCDILGTTSTHEYMLALNEGAVYTDSSIKLSKPVDKLFVLFSLLVAAYFTFNVGRAMQNNALNIDFTGLQVFNTIFLSILIQAFPYIIFGVLVSSVIQVFVPEEAITKIFPRNKAAGFFVALVGGVFFPICDCAIVPITGRLIKKGVPLPCAITFMLAAPIVDPVVVASTIYAFPGDLSIAFHRVWIGIAVALVIGITLMLFPEKNTLISNNINLYSCRCGYCGSDMDNGKGILSKFGVMIKHAGVEFFDVGKYLIIGAFISSVMQTLVPSDILARIGAGEVSSLVVMMFAAFVLSVCSTSDAFIAKSFLNQFSMGSVMGFMVTGAMIDIKNLSMLLGIFKKRFVVKLVIMIAGISFAMLYFISSIIF